MPQLVASSDICTNIQESANLVFGFKFRQSLFEQMPGRVILPENFKAVQNLANKWLTTLKSMRFSDKEAKLMAAMTKITLKEDYEKPKSPIRNEHL